LISNTYMSDISIDLSLASNWTKSNISNSSYIYQASTKGYLTCASGVPVGNCKVGAFQGFWIQATGVPALSINEQAKISTTNSNTLQRVAQVDPLLNYLGITLSSSASKNINSTYIRYVDGADYGNDVFDGLKLGATQRTYLSDLGIYTKAVNNVFYDVNAKPYQFLIDTTELFVKAPFGNATLNFSDVANLEFGYQITLVDKFAQTLTDVSVNPNYDFVVTADSNSSGPRFQVVINNGKTTDVIDDNVSSGVAVNVYPNPTTSSNVKLTISNYSGKADVKLYDLFGSVVFTQQVVVDHQLLLPLALPNLASGVYTLKVNGTDFTTTKKLVIK